MFFHDCALFDLKLPKPCIIPRSSRFVRVICIKRKEDDFESIHHVLQNSTEVYVETSITGALEPIYGLTMHFVSSPVIGTYTLTHGEKITHTQHRMPYMFII